ncbi:MAG: CRTAC1 family protein, partial [Planctomycetota bacterium]
YANDGAGSFTDVSDSVVDQRHLFGMAHTFGDFNLDGRLDLYAIGMSSTTARRLDGLQLRRPDRRDVDKMRAAMAYGNRMYLNDGSRFATPKFADQVARTGWSWGTTSFDYDLDGDEDVYVANGFRSGDSCTDYCSTYWRHDLYTGNSTPNPAVAALFRDAMSDLNAGAISWNGFEHNALLQNLGGEAFANVGFLLGVGFEYDSRAVVGGDLDGDGLPDLMVAEYQFAGRGFLMKLHVYRNTLETQNHWLGVRLEEPAPGGLNGTKVRLQTGDRQQVRQLVTGDSFMSQHANAVHFGLGSQTTVDRVTIEWPDGSTFELTEPKIDRYHTVSGKEDGVAADDGRERSDRRQGKRVSIASAKKDLNQAIEYGPAAKAK